MYPRPDGCTSMANRSLPPAKLRSPSSLAPADPIRTFSGRCSRTVTTPLSRTSSNKITPRTGSPEVSSAVSNALLTSMGLVKDPDTRVTSLMFNAAVTAWQKRVPTGWNAPNGSAHTTAEASGSIPRCSNPARIRDPDVWPSSVSLTPTARRAPAATVSSGANPTLMNVAPAAIPSAITCPQDGSDISVRMTLTPAAIIARTAVCAVNDSPGAVPCTSTATCVS
mmetsp:Transcript_35299/g.80650  ORF Transcript_35299/g.80650 Transcript_35299/m.80650 type:complete len:224 (+) Transcript_35299:3364-4035(+)